MTTIEKNIKQVFDFSFAFIGLIFTGWFILLLAVISKLYLGGRGFFRQKRVGQYGNIFTIYKIESIYPKGNKLEGPRITKFGNFIRKSKLDELPQLFNVLIGNMSFIGPRPDIQGFADELKGGDRVILFVKPGISGPASLYFRNEEKILTNKKHTIGFNKDFIWRKKVELNKKYVLNYSLIKDFIYLYKSIITIFD